MAAMTNAELEARIQHVNERINRLMDIVTKMEGKLQDVHSALEGFQQGTNGFSAQALFAPQPKQLPMLSGSTGNQSLQALSTLVPLLQSVADGIRPDPQTLVQGLAALINLREALAGRASGAPAYSVPVHSSVGNSSINPNSFVIFLVLVLILLGRQR